MSQAERDARIKEGFHVIERTARSLIGKRPPRGVTLEDLCSLGAEELIKAADKYDPREQRPWLGFLTQWLKYRFRDYLRTARKRESRTAPMEIETDAGDSFPRPDGRAKNPADLAAAREERAAGKKAVVDASLGPSLPPPGEVAAKAVEYRDALRAAVPPSELGNLLKAMHKQGMGGDVAAAKLVFAIMQPAGPPPAQPAINVRVVLPGDDDDE